MDIPELGLHPEDKVCLAKGKWLTDNIINAAQRLLKTTHSHIGGLQDTLLGETLSFEIQHGVFVQILNVSQSHWITVSNVGCKKGVVNIYDSIPSFYVPTCTKEQIAAILFANEKTLTLEYKAVQVQQGINDCGLFAIAFATSLCGRENPVEINYKQHLLCSHLLNCVTKQEISVFPRLTRKRKVTKSRGMETFELFCQCRLPEQGRIIQCDHCQEWYHSKCVTVPESVWKAKNAKWFCKICKYKTAIGMIAPNTILNKK